MFSCLDEEAFSLAVGSDPSLVWVKKKKKLTVGNLELHQLSFAWIIFSKSGTCRLDEAGLYKQKDKEKKSNLVPKDNDVP